MHNGNPNLRGQFESIEYTQEQLEEYLKCRDDFFYFCENYCYIRSGTNIVKFIPYDYQKELVKDILSNKFSLAKMSRQSGKSTILSALITWFVIFEENYEVLIAAHVHKQAIEIMGRCKTIIENLPLWLQDGIVKWNELEIVLENNSKITSSATTKNAARGRSPTFILLDEFAFVDTNIANEFYNSIYPTLSAPTNTKAKLVIISTPNGMNHFYKLAVDAKSKKNNFKYNEINWNDVPGRDDAFREKTIKDVGLDRWEQEFECIFLGGEDALISPGILKRIVFDDPLETLDNGCLKVFKRPRQDNTYMMTVDPSRGKGIDSSAIVVFNVSKYPIEVVAHYRDPNISNIIFPGYINRLGKIYNDAACLVEINDSGGQVADMLFDEFEYVNLLGCIPDGRNGQKLKGYGIKGKGLKQSQVTKRVGCSNLKSLIDLNKIVINSFDIVSELSNFVRKDNSYGASTGNHDDLVMCLVIMAWITQQPFFKNYVELGMKDVFANEFDDIDNDMLPLGRMDDGVIPFDDDPLRF